MLEFTRYRFHFYVVSLILLVPGVISLLLPGGIRPSIDFTSGTLMTLRFVEAVEQGALRQTLDELGHPEAIVQRSGDGLFIVRTAPLAQPRADVTDGGQSGSG